MRIGTRWVLLAVALAASSASAQPWGAMGLRADRPSRSPACEAARESAESQILHRLRDLRVSESATLGSLAGPAHPLWRELEAQVAALPDAGTPRTLPDGTCELTLELRLEVLAGPLAQALRRHDLAGRAQLDRLAALNGQPIFRATGRGRPGGLQRSRELPPLWQARCTEPGRRAAVQAARQDALRKLAAQLQALPLGEAGRVRDLMTNQPAVVAVVAAVAAQLALAREKGTLYHTDELIVDVVLELPLQPVLEAIRRAQPEGPARLDDAQIRHALAAAGPTLQATGSGVPPESSLRPTGPATPLARPDWPASLSARGQASVQAGPNPGQARLLALRQAEQQARESLAQQARALPVTPRTRLADLADRHAPLAADLATLIRQAPATQTTLEGNTAHATVQLDTARLWHVVEYWTKQLKLTP